MKDSLLFCLDGREELAKSIVTQVNKWSENNKTELGFLRNQKFSDGELCVDYTNSVRGKRVYILSSPHNSDEIIKLNLAIDAAKRGAASEIIPILPYFPYSRQDKKDQSRGPIGAKVMAEMIEQRGATSVITFDLHADQIQGFFNIPVTHIEGKNVFDEYISSITKDNTILASPDAGGVKRVKRMCDKLNKKFDLNLSYITMDKTRTKANEIDSISIIGDVTNKNVILIDDMIDTFGSAGKAVECLLINGANNIYMIASHGVLSGPAMDRLSKSKLEKLIISDSLSIKDKINYKGYEKIEVISLSESIGLAMAAINSNSSYEKIMCSKA